MKKVIYAAAAAILAAMLIFAALFLLSGPEPEPEPEVTPPPAMAATPSPTAAPTPTPSPSPTPTPEPQPEYFVFSFVGDCTLASSQHHKGASFAFESVVGEDYAYPFAKTVEYFQNDYMSVANMEGVFTTSDKSNGATFVFKSDPAYAGVFSQGGIEAVTLGNNHSGDFGAQGREDTCKALEDAGVLYALDGESCIYSSGDGPKVGLYSKLYPSVQDVVTGVEALKEAGADIIIAGLHWGFEGSYRVTADQEAVGRAAIDAGAAIVYGSHPHVLQRTEEYGGGCILYSLGNWSFGGNTAPRDRDTAIVRVTMRRDPGGAISYEGMELIPCELSSTPGVNDYQPHPYEAGSEGYERAMSKLLGTFDGPDLSIDYSAFHQNPSEEPSPAPEPEPQPAPEPEPGGGELIPQPEAPGSGLEDPEN